MPSFDLKCPNCEEIYHVTFEFSEYEEVKKQKCPRCPETTLERVWHRSGPQVFIPAQFGSTKKGFI
jgi:putative FmdB family regulatory protein